MYKGIGIIRRTIVLLIALVLAAGYPVTAMADTQDPMIPISEEPVQPPAAPEEPKLTYTYNPTTEHWDSEKWQYNAQTGTYETPPTPMVIEPVTNESTTQVDTTVTIDNTVNSDAASGDAAVANNTSGGNATTGDAVAMATLLNSVNSSIATGDNQKVATFTQDILGDVKGDIMLYPMLLKAMLEAEAGNTSSTIDVHNNLQLNNDVNLHAASGNAAVTGNTAAGDATTGSAHVVANVVNILNSMIATQQSFIGTINIYGSLEGDILIAPDFLPQMIASNKDADSEVTVSSQDTQTIVNNISAVAESGAAEVFGNTAAGNARSGDADSNVVIFNLSGHEVIAKNSLLVFVNVLGKWVGVIVDAPEGATAALIGNEVTTNSVAPDLTVTSESVHGITNNISVTAQSGDAMVSNNTAAGNAVTGQAMAMANIANVSGSQFGLSDWFGVLFINVFQDWHGSFGINTLYGDEVDSAPEQPTGPIQFIPQSQEVEQRNVLVTIIESRPLASIDTELMSKVVTGSATVLAAAVEAPTPAIVAAYVSRPHVPSFDIRLFIIAGSILVIGLTSLGLKRLFS